MNDEIDFLPLRALRVRRNGKREYDPADKRRWVSAPIFWLRIESWERRWQLR